LTDMKTALLRPGKYNVASDLWSRYIVRWDFITRLCAQMPADPEIVKAMVEARKPKVRPAISRSIDEINAEVFATLKEQAEEEEEEQFNMLVFQRIRSQKGDEVLVLRSGTIKAHMKDCARQISARLGSIQGERAFSTKIINWAYPSPMEYWIPIRRPEDGAFITKPDGEKDQPVHIRDRSGTRTALKRYEFVEGGDAMIQFELMVFEGPSKESSKDDGKTKRRASIPIQDLELLFSYGGTHGYGGERGIGEGKYVFNIQRAE